MQHVMDIPDSTGHTSVSWSSGNAAEMAIARAAFDDAIKRGMRAFRITRSGGQGERMEEFDEEAEKVLFVPHLRGG